MNKKIIVLLIFVITLLIVGCRKADNEELELRMIYPDGLPAIAMSKFIKENSIENVKINSELQKTTDALLAETIKGDADLAVVPSNIALKVAEKNLDYKILGTIGWGSLYLVSTEDVDDLNELYDYEIYNTGKGLTPDIITNNILSAKNLDTSKLNYSYVNAASELAPLIIGGKAKVAVIPEPVLSTIKSKNINLNIILDLNQEWKSIYKNKLGYPQSTLIIKTDLFNKLKDDGRLALLLDTLQNDINWVNNNSNSVAGICEELGITVNKSVVPDAIENANLNFISYDKSIEEYKAYFNEIGGVDTVYSKLFE